MPARTKIAMIIMDGLGGLPLEPGGKTELETARTPNLDALAAQSALGLTVPVGPGITPGSGPGHLAIFGYDPIQYEIGRGALEALGVDFELGPDDVAARGNFCTVDAAGVVTDRRAGRIPTEVSRELAEPAAGNPVRGRRVLCRDGEGAPFRLCDARPGTGRGADRHRSAPGRACRRCRCARWSRDRKRRRGLANQFIDQARELLAGTAPGRHKHDPAARF